MARYYGYGNNINVKPWAAGSGGFAEGLNEAFGRFMEERRQENLLNQAQIQKIMSTIDVPDMLVQKHQAEALDDLNKMKTDIITMTQSKRGWQRGQYTQNEVLDVQRMAHEYMKKFQKYTQQDNIVREEYKKFDPKLYDEAEMKARLNTYQTTGELPYGTILVPNAADINSLYMAANEVAKNIGMVPGWVNMKNGTEVSNYDQFKEAPVIRNQAYDNFFMSPGGDRAVIKEMVRNITPEQVNEIANAVGVDPTKALQTIGVGNINSREAELDPSMKKMAYVWGKQNIVPTILKSQTRMAEMPKPEDTEKNELGYTETKNAQMIDKTVAPVRIDFNKPVKAVLAAKFVHSIYDGKPFGGNDAVEVEIDNMGGNYAYGTARFPSKEIDEETFLKEGGPKNKELFPRTEKIGDQETIKYYRIGKTAPVKVNLDKSKPFILDKIPSLKDRIVYPKEESFSVGSSEYTRKQLNNMGYSDKKIDDAIKSGKIKKL